MRENDENISPSVNGALSTPNNAAAATAPDAPRAARGASAGLRQRTQIAPFSPVSPSNLPSDDGSWMHSPKAKTPEARTPQGHEAALAARSCRRTLFR